MAQLAAKEDGDFDDEEYGEEYFSDDEDLE